MFRNSRSDARKPARSRLRLESFESRIVPAGAVVHFFEVDGDKITVKTNKGTNTDLLAVLSSQAGAITEGGTGVTSFDINLILNATTATAFAGTNLTISASKTKGVGNNRANFVTINGFDGGGANNIDLGKVTIKGNLVYIDAGDNNLVTPAIAKLDVLSWGPADGDVDATSSEICGNITSIKVKNDFNGFIISEDAAGTPNFQTANATVIGSFYALYIASGNGNDVGHIQVGNISKLTVKETFFGGLGAVVDCGLIEAGSIDILKIKRMSINARIVLS